MNKRDITRAVINGFCLVAAAGADKDEEIWVHTMDHYAKALAKRIRGER